MDLMKFFVYTLSFFLFLVCRGNPGTIGCNQVKDNHPALPPKQKTTIIHLINLLSPRLVRVSRRDGRLSR